MHPMLVMLIWCLAYVMPARSLARLSKDATARIVHLQRLTACMTFAHLGALTNAVADTMPICIECRYPVKTLYTEYSGADDRSSGHGVRLTVCKNCGRFCDKYVEHDYVVLFIDLVLIKPQVCGRLFCGSIG